MATVEYCKLPDGPMSEGQPRAGKYLMLTGKEEQHNYPGVVHYRGMLESKEHFIWRAVNYYATHPPKVEDEDLPTSQAPGMYAGGAVSGVVGLLFVWGFVNNILDENPSWVSGIIIGICMVIFLAACVLMIVFAHVFDKTAKDVDIVRRNQDAKNKHAAFLDKYKNYIGMAEPPMGADQKYVDRCRPDPFYDYDADYRLNYAGNQMVL